MRRQRSAVLVLAVLASGCASRVSVPSPAAPVHATAGATVPFSESTIGERHQLILRTVPDPVPCDGTVRNFKWVAPRDLQIESVQIWIGTTWTHPDTPERRPMMDVWTSVLGPGGYVLGFVGLDHYAAFSGLHQETHYFSPPLALAQGDGVTLQHQCTNYGPGHGGHSATNAIINWR